LIAAAARTKKRPSGRDAPDAVGTGTVFAEADVIITPTGAEMQKPCRFRRRRVADVAGRFFVRAGMVGNELTLSATGYILGF